MGEQIGSGDLALSALYNVNQQTLWIPAFGAAIEVTLPTGVDSSGVDVQLTGIVTRSIERLSLHLNVGYAFLTSTAGDDREGRWDVALGASYPIGAPQYTRATLIADVFAEQASRRGEPAIVGVEGGFRYQVAPRLVWDVGISTELRGPGDRQQLFFTTGVSLGF